MRAVDREVVGKLGRVVTRIRGGDLPGEVLVTLRGMRETLLAYSPDPVERDVTVIVYSSHGPRAVDVEPAPWAQH